MDEKKTEVSIKVSAPYDADSCGGVLAICSWIKEAVCKCGIEIKSEEYSFRCSFKAGDISMIVIVWMNLKNMHLGKRL